MTFLLCTKADISTWLQQSLTIPDVVNHVAYQVIGSDITVNMAAESGQLQLNAMEPIITYRLLEAACIVHRAMETLTFHCVNRIDVDSDRCCAFLNANLISATDLVPPIGCDAATQIAKLALAEGLAIHEARESLGFNR